MIVIRAIKTYTEEWLEELEVDEETYMANLHRLGNLTLAAKPDNSKMSNQLWDYKNDILKSTGHLKMNMELLSIPKWTIECIDERTESLIQRIDVTSMGLNYILMLWQLMNSPNP